MKANKTNTGKVIILWKLFYILFYFSHPLYYSYPSLDYWRTFRKMNKRISSLILIFVLLPSCSTKKNIVEQSMPNLILSQLTSDISITYKKDGTFINYTCDTKTTEQQINKNYDAIKQKCIEKITQLFANHQNREHLKSQILETILTVSTDNEIDHLKKLLQMST